MEAERHTDKNINQTYSDKKAESVIERFERVRENYRRILKEHPYMADTIHELYYKIFGVRLF